MEELLLDEKLALNNKDKNIIIEKNASNTTMQVKQTSEWIYITERIDHTYISSCHEILIFDIKSVEVYESIMAIKVTAQ